MSKTFARLCVLALLATAALVSLTACRKAEYGMLTEHEREELRRIEPLELTPAPPEEEDVPTVPPEAEPPDYVELTLEQCRAIALRRNLDLRVELVNPLIAAEAVREADARFEPTLFAGAAYTRTEGSSLGEPERGGLDRRAADVGVVIPLRTGGEISLDMPVSRSESRSNPSGFDPAYAAGLTANVRHPLLRGAGRQATEHAIRIAAYQAEMAHARTRLEVIRVIAAVDRLYWRLYAARRTLQVRKNEYDLSVAQLERARRMVEAGVLPEVEIVRAEAGVAQRVEAVIIADNQLRDRERELKRALNQPDLGVLSPTAIVPGTEPLPVRYRLDLPTLAETALANRMEMLQLELQIARDAADIEFSRNQTLPFLALDYTYNVSGLGPTLHDAFDMMLRRDADEHRVGLQFSMPLGNQAALSRLRRDVLLRTQRLATREARALLIEQEVAGAVDQLEGNWQRVVASRHSAVLAHRSLEAEERQFGMGLRTSTDVLDAQTRLAEAELAVIRAEVEYQIAKVDLAFATGTLLGEAAVQWTPAVPPAD